jgi:hypothetical protein
VLGASCEKEEQRQKAGKGECRAEGGNEPFQLLIEKGRSGRSVDGRLGFVVGGVLDKGVALDKKGKKMTASKQEKDVSLCWRGRNVRAAISAQQSSRQGI